MKNKLYNAWLEACENKQAIGSVIQELPGELQSIIVEHIDTHTMALIRSISLGEAASIVANLKNTTLGNIAIGIVIGMCLQRNNPNIFDSKIVTPSTDVIQ